jgi:hypothetical protein
MSELRRAELELRDRFFALAGEHASEDELRRFRAQVQATQATPLLELDGLSLSFFPSARFKALRFVEAERIDEAHRSLFARPSPGMPNLAAVFVDPEEFSYRNFENILPLDRFFAGIELELGLGQRTKLRPGRVRALGGGEAQAQLGRGREAQAYQFTLQVGPQTRAALLGLDALDLYLTPQNPESRGGARFIFHSARLSEALGSAVRTALPKRWQKGFSHVNPVFRCNRFAPGDTKFRRHIDTPYYDAGRKHVSRYTMLIYLTGGRAQPALQIGDDIAVEEIEAMTCVVFRQDQPHEGAAFIEGRKVFLRTELIFEDPSVTHDPGIAQTFAKACYFTGESVFAPELARHTHELYERAAAAHWAGPRASNDEDEPYLHKRFCEFDFVSNGYDFWFPKHGPSLQECAALAVLDVLNCKVGGQAFRKLCKTDVLTRSGPPSTWIPELLASCASTEAREELFAKLDLPILFPPPEDVDTRACCPFHAFAIWDASRNEETVDLYTRAQRFAQRRLAGAAITMMGQEIFLDRDKFVIENGKIHILSEQALAPVNFAACWNDGSSPANYLDVEVTIEAPYLLLPPILFVETEHARHLMLDLFRNSWMVSQRPRAVPVPKIRHFGPDDYANEAWNSTPWIDAAAPEARVGDEDDSGDPWWGEDDVVRELYADTPDED